MNMIKIRKAAEEPNLIHWGGDDPFTHTLIVGPTRCGKSATVIKPLIYSILLAKKRGQKAGISVIEPKGDIARMVKEMAEEMGLGDELVYIDPLYPDETHRINVMKGEKNDVAEATVAVLKSLFGKQDAFFATVQELSSRKVTLLLKELYGDNMDIMDVLANLRDEALLKNNVEKLRQLQGTTDLVQFFDNELLGTGNMADKYRQFIVGLRAQLENITSNEHLRAIVTGKSDIDLDEHFEKGSILAVNTALGKLGRAGDAFGMFMAMHLQLATFRRPGTERTRIPHYLIIDEYSRYINPDVERFLSISAEYRVALIAAIQSLGQLELESGTMSAKAMKRAILTSTRNKIVFGGLEYEDAEEVAKIMGKNVIKERTRMFDGGILANILPKSYKDQEIEKERFYSTFIMDGLPRFHYIHKLIKDVTAQEPGIGVGDFIPRNWLELLHEEENALLNQKKPFFWNWQERAEYEVQRHRLEEQIKFRERAKTLFEEDPFDHDSINQSATQVEVEVTSPSVSDDSHTNVKTETVEESNKTPIIFSLQPKKTETETEIATVSLSHKDLEPEEVQESVFEDWADEEIEHIPSELIEKVEESVEDKKEMPSQIKENEEKKEEVTEESFW